MIKLWVPDDYLSLHTYDWWVAYPISEPSPWHDKESFINWYRRKLQLDTINAFFLEDVFYNAKYWVDHILNLLVADWLTGEKHLITKVSCQEEAEHLIDIIMAYEDWTRGTIIYDEDWTPVDVTA